MARASSSRTDSAGPVMGQVLASFDDQRLIGLLAARPDLTNPRPVNFGELGTRASAWPSLHACFRTLDQTRRQLIEALCLLPNPVELGQLAAVLGTGLSAEAVRAPLQGLEDLGLVHIEHGRMVAVAPGLRQLRFPGGLGPPVAVAFEGLPATHLADIARRLRIPKSRTKAETLRTLSAALGDPAVLRGAIASGPPGTAELAAKLAAGPPVTPVAGGWYHTQERSPDGWLANRGLLAIPGWGEAIMPGEVGLALRGHRLFPTFSLDRPPVTTVACDPEVVETAGAESGLRLIADLASVLLEWESSPPKLLKSGGLGLRDLRRAAASTGRDEADAARIIELSSMAGLIGFRDASTDEPALVLPTSAFDQWMAAGPGERWAAVVSAWLDSGSHLAAALEANASGGLPRPLLARPSGAAAGQRTAVLAVLAGLRSDRAAAADDSLAAMVTWEAPALWETGPVAPVAMILAEAELLGLAASGSLTTPGRLAGSGRLSDAAQAMAARAPAVVSDFVVQADLTAVAAGILSAAARAELDLLADVESTGAATVYRFSPSSLVRGFDAGRTPEQIGAWLAEHSKNPVPQPLSYLVTDLGRRYGRLRVGRAQSYVRCDDPSLLVEVLRAKATAPLSLRQLAPGVLVSPCLPAKVTAALRTAGYLASTETDDGILVIRRPDRPRAATPSRRPADRLVAAARPAKAKAATGQTGDAAGSLMALVTALRKAPTGLVPPSQPVLSDDSEDLFAAAAAMEGDVDLDDLDFDDMRDPSDIVGDGIDERYDRPVREPAASKPFAIVKEGDAILALLRQAREEDWLVRVEYTSGNGLRRQLNVAPMHFDDGLVVVEIPERANLQTLAIDRIHWARVLTDAEESLIF